MEQTKDREGTALSRWLAVSPTAIFTAYTVLVSFSTYFCMYAFRKPFSVGEFHGTVALPLVGSLGHKTVFILAQALGYCISKFLGIKVVSEMTPARRAWAIIACIGIAELGLLMFAVVPAPYAAIGMLVNGLPLGMIWGLVFGFLEGRRTSDLLGAALCASFIFASGFVKSVGKLVLGWGVSETWMPALTGAMFFPALALSVALLAQIPPPSAEDERLRVKREPMDAAARRTFFWKYAPGLIAIVAGYVVLTALRDFRDNFSRELWDALGYGDRADVFATAEIPVGVGALLAVGLIIAVRDNKRALLATHALMVAGAALVGVSTLLHATGALGPMAWMISVGLGLYIGYVPVNCVIFDRLIAATGSIGTAGFLIYVADAFGYLGSAALLIYKNLGQPKLAWLPFFERFAYVAAGSCALLFAASAGYFSLSKKTSRVADVAPAAL